MGTICQKRNYLHVRCRWKVTSSKAKFKHFANLEDIFYRGSSGKISFYSYATPRVGDGICGLRPISQKKRRMCSSIRQPLLRPKRTIKVIKNQWYEICCYAGLRWNFSASESTMEATFTVRYTVMSHTNNIRSKCTKKNWIAFPGVVTICEFVLQLRPSSYTHTKKEKITA